MGLDNESHPKRWNDCVLCLNPAIYQTSNVICEVYDNIPIVVVCCSRWKEEWKERCAYLAPTDTYRYAILIDCQLDQRYRYQVGIEEKKTVWTEKIAFLAFRAWQVELYFLINESQIWKTTFIFVVSQHEYNFLMLFLESTFELNNSTLDHFLTTTNGRLRRSISLFACLVLSY